MSDLCPDCNQPRKNGRCPRCDGAPARRAVGKTGLKQPIRCPACRDGWITRSVIVAGVLRETAARCQCLHRAILEDGGDIGKIACAQDHWGSHITQAECDAERDRLIAYQLQHRNDPVTKPVDA